MGLRLGGAHSPPRRRARPRVRWQLVAAAISKSRASTELRSLGSRDTKVGSSFGLAGQGFNSRPPHPYSPERLHRNKKLSNLAL